MNSVIGNNFDLKKTEVCNKKKTILLIGRILRKYIIK